MEGAENMTILWAITKVVGGLLAVDVALCNARDRFGCVRVWSGRLAGIQQATGPRPGRALRVANARVRIPEEKWG